MLWRPFRAGAPDGPQETTADSPRSGTHTGAAGTSIVITPVVGRARSPPWGAATTADFPLWVVLGVERGVKLSSV
jgi:hypothetical protein